MLEKKHAVHKKKTHTLLLRLKVYIHLTIHLPPPPNKVVLLYKFLYDSNLHAE